MVILKGVVYQTVEKKVVPFPPQMAGERGGFQLMNL